MWPLYQLIRTLEIHKYCEISWDLLKYIHLENNAVYNSSAKNDVVDQTETQTAFADIKFARQNRPTIYLPWVLSISFLRIKSQSQSLFVQFNLITELELSQNVIIGYLFVNVSLENNFLQEQYLANWLAIKLRDEISVNDQTSRHK